MDSYPVPSDLFFMDAAGCKIFASRAGCTTFWSKYSLLYKTYSFTPRDLCTSSAVFCFLRLNFLCSWSNFIYYSWLCSSTSVFLARCVFCWWSTYYKLVDAHGEVAQTILPFNSRRCVAVWLNLLKLRSIQSRHLLLCWNFDTIILHNGWLYFS